MNVLKSKRVEMGLKQNAVARRLGISLRHYQRFENENREVSEEKIEALAKIFNCNVAEIKQKE